MSEKSDENKVMYRTLNWQEQIEAIAGPRQFGDTRESWLARAARKSGTAFWHIKALYYGQLTDPKFSIASKIISAADKARIQKAKSDGAKLADTYQSAAIALGNLDPDFHRNSIDALVNAARILGALDSSGTDGEVK